MLISGQNAYISGAVIYQANTINRVLEWPKRAFWRHCRSRPDKRQLLRACGAGCGIGPLLGVGAGYPGLPRKQPDCYPPCGLVTFGEQAASRRLKAASDRIRTLQSDHPMYSLFGYMKRGVFPLASLRPAGFHHHLE